MKRNLIQTILELIFPILLFLLIIGLRQIFNRDSHPFEELDGTVDHLIENKTIFSSVGFNKVVVKSYLNSTVNLKVTDLFDVNKYTREDISNLDLSEIDITELIDIDKIDEFRNDLYNNYTLAQYYLSYLELPIYINPYYICSVNNSKRELKPKIALIGDVPEGIVYKMIKDSIIYNTFTPIKYELNEDSFLRFKTIKDMEKVIKGKNYKNKKDDLICFGLKFLYDQTNNTYDYSLHFFDFEIIGRGDTSDIPTCKYGMFDKYQNGPDLQSYGIYTNGGYNYVMKVVNEYILKQQTNEKYSSLSYAVTPMKYIDYRVDPFGQFFGNVTVICILIAYIFPLNIYVYKIVKEKETRIREGMKIMGLGDGEYFLSYFIQYVIISVFVTAINAYIYQQVLTTIPYYYLYCIIFLFSLDVFALVYFCQSFIDKTKISIVLTFIIYAIMYCLILTCVFENSGGFRFKLFMSLVPSVNLNLSIALLFKFDYHFKKFYDRDFTIDHYNYSLFGGFIMFGVDFILYIFLGYYFNNVLPHDYGIRKPWYFLFTTEYWCKKRAKKYYTKKEKQRLKEFQNDESKTLDEESISYIKDKNALKRLNLYRNDSNFESEDIYEDKTENDIFEIRNIVKIFDDGKKAVGGVNLNFYKDEIFALLGHNGAGKTTLISILTGMYEATKGKAIFDGNNILDSNNMDIFREKVGICPQHDTLFEELTIREHLEMFSVLKGVSKDKVDEEVAKVLRDFQIGDIQNMLAGNLSAGQRRKLSIAISLIGGSEVIFLDEPSSGMDITSRRNLWEILKHQCNGKIIILTTHYMEEASVLGKRIGIINAGKMKCLGSPLFLIEKYGRYMSLTVTKEEDADNEQIIEFVKSLSKNVEYEVLSEEILFRIPMKDDKNEEKKLKKILDIPTFFKNFDENINNLKIKSYRISMPTLEDVFLNVAAEDDKKIQKEKEKENELIIQTHESSEQLLFKEDLKDKYSGCEKFNRDFLISMKRRFIMTKRDLKGLMMEIVGPVLLVIFGLLLSLLQIVDKSEPHEIKDLEITGNQIVLFSSLTGSKYQDYFNEIENDKYFVKFNETNDYKDCVIKYQYVKKYIENVYDIYHTTETTADKEVDMSSDDYVGYYGSILMISEQETPNYEFVFNLNARVTHSVPIYSYYFLKSIIEKEAKKYNPDRELKIKFTHYPMPFTDDIKEQDDIINNEAIMFFFSIAFAIMPANFISMLVKERVNNSKHLMRVSGMNILSYWIVNYIFEFIKYYFTGGLCLLTLYIFGDYKDYIYILYLIYGPAMISSTYFISFFFEDESKAQNFVILVNLVFGSLGCIVILLLRLLDNTRTLGEILEYFVAIVPVFNFDFAYNIAINKNKIYSHIFEPEEYLKFTGDEMIKKFSLMLMLVYYCSSEVVIYTILFIIAESRTYSFKRPENKKLISKVNDSEVIKEIEKTNSLEVSFLKEEEFETTRNTLSIFKPSSKEQIAVKVKNLRKIYGNGCLSKQKIVAVDNLNFCLESGECFGLLGLNGAGKTTTFKCITQEISPDNGEITIYGKDIRGNFNELNDLFGYCPQFDAIFEFLTVYENLEFYATIKGVKKNYIDALIKNMILEMALTEFTHKIAGRLSGGNKRKLSVAISMLGNPPIVLLDEPSTGMDPEARRFMWSVIHKISTKGRKSSVILTTNSMDEAETLCKRMGIMVNGEFVCLGSATQIKDTYGYGYECNLRIKPLPQEEILEILSKSLINYDRVTNENLSQILNSLNKGKFLDELKPGRLGGRIIKNINLNGYVHIQTFLNWIFFVENSLKFIIHGKEYFSQIILSEYIENNFIFKLLKGKEKYSIGFLFGLYEEKKDECHVTEYSLQQTSLEQIFNKFASNQGKYNEEVNNIQLEEYDDKGIVIDENLLVNLLE